MHCPFCRINDTKVIDSRLVADGTQVRRRRECQNKDCAERFTTFESAELLMPRLIKANGSRVPFDEDKLRNGILRAVEKRPVGIERIDTVVSRIQQKLQGLGEREIKTRVVGELVMSELRDLDDVAYVRFASVYRRFEDVHEFKREIDLMDQNPSKPSLEQGDD